MIFQHSTSGTSLTIINVEKPSKQKAKRHYLFPFNGNLYSKIEKVAGLNLLYNIYVMKSTMLKLRPTARKCKVIATNFDPILMPFDFCKFGMGNVTVPYLHKNIQGLLVSKDGESKKEMNKT